nr:(E)-4-hydroxy-3-methylbut-2-enyl-diphosphate synthase [Planctomycetota bacterium]
MSTPTAPAFSAPYVPSRFAFARRASRAVRVGSLVIGGGAPVVVQSMCTTPTQDVAATIAQCISLAEVGCELVRITAPGVKDAQALKHIRSGFSAAGFAHVPLVADIHFMPAAAMEAIEHVEKVRVNPGNFADKKRFAVIEYSDADYRAELERVAERFLPLVTRAKQLGRALRIGTNHGSLSDRIMNRFGDSPRGMVESAMEFVQIAESAGYKDLIISMKSSNPKVMVAAYRMLCARLADHGEAYPLHLGVTEAGDGEDGRTKSAAGIGALLADGIGDTIRVSLTEPPEAEIPVARRLLAAFAHGAAPVAAIPTVWPVESIDPYAYRRRVAEIVRVGADVPLGGGLLPR